MVRIILFIVMLSAVIYAVADWWRTPQESMPGGLRRHLWLIVILMTAPTMAIGAWAWIIMRAVLQAEARQRGESRESTLLEDVASKFQRSAESPAAPVAPDDDPEFLEKLQRDIARQRAHEREAAQREEMKHRAHSQHTGRDDGESAPESETLAADASGTGALGKGALGERALGERGTGASDTGATEEMGVVEETGALDEGSGQDGSGRATTGGVSGPGSDADTPFDDQDKPSAEKR